MTKRWLSIGVLFLALFILGACSSSEEESGGEESAEKFELKFGMVAGNQQNEYKAAEKLAEYVDKESDGRLTVKLYPNSQLGDDRAMLEQASEGSLDITLAETGRFGIWVPRASLMGLPYIVDNYEHITKVLNDTEYGKGLKEELAAEHNWVLAGNAYNGTRQTTSNRAIESLADMKGLKLRVPEAQNLLDYANFTGASATPMAFTEVYLALQTNAVDGQENPLSTIDAQKFYEVQDYLAITNHVLNDVNYVVSKQTMDKLPEDLKEIFQAGIEEATTYHTTLFEEQEASLVEKFKEEGMTVTEPDLEEFKTAVSEAYPSYLEEIGEGAEDYLKEIQGAND
ncbi:TRAP-type transport system, sialic acid-binding periplasmic protein [Planococcus sp. PAMC 21323]|uniref:sialic acid TRAP transporter substrate-binding protein SiaP n=1 Tax=Planococcus sp. PAMC 21323 TaxID=1526927 RepID=UPI000571592F|nr:sialic acid TRAP transporter substrate-binding protein SiaP [Planococcus sp. PAMC 21323]AIY06796.1 TRAP-type transport system, sialic acid-binding periplasmic protein [Planococcus sp. PAMC 21323]